MRILQVVPYYPPAWGYGGPPRVMFSLARELVRRGHQVTVYTSDAWDETRRVSERVRDLDGVTVRAFPNVSNRLAWRRKMFVPAGLVGHLSRTAGDFDVAHISAVRSVLHVRVHRALQRARLPYVIDAHGALPRPVGWRRGLAQVYDPLFLRPLLAGASALLAQTEHEATLYRSYVPGGAVEPLALAIELAEMARPMPAGFLRERLGVGKDAFVALFLGRIEARKGVDFLVEGFAEYLRGAPRPSYLAIVGRDSGSLPSVLSRIAELGLGERIRFLGPAYGDERLAAYRDADCFVTTPGYWEETSLAALEACACGTPCIVTRQAEIPGLDEAGAGFTIAHGDRVALVAAVRRLADEPDARKRMGRAAADLITRRFAVEHVAVRLEEILRRAANGRRAP